jgi:hypothetical protein
MHPYASVNIGVFDQTPRIIFGGSTTHEIDNFGGVLRFLRPGVTDMSIDSQGFVSIAGVVQISPVLDIGTVTGASLQVGGLGAQFTGTIATETHTDASVYIGVLDQTPRIIFGGSTTHEIDNSEGYLRFLRPGAENTPIGPGTADMLIQPNGAVSVIGDHQVGGTQSIIGNVSVGGNTSVRGNHSVLGNISVGGNHSVAGNVSVVGDITLTNADCAEEFDIATATEVEPGTVMVLYRNGSLQPSEQACDKKVAGVISGAGGYKPGLILDKKETSEEKITGRFVG